MDANKIHGIDRLIELRRQGIRPELAFVMFLDGGRLSASDVGINPSANVERLDLRPFVGLQVLVIADDYSPALFRLFERLQEYAEVIVLPVMSWLPDDLGFIWCRGDTKPRMLGDAPQEVAA